MKVSDLKDKAQVDELIVTVKDLQEPSETRFGLVQTAVSEDDTGSVQVSLWNEDVGSLAIGDKIKISKGWSKSYQDQMQVSKGKFGTIEKVQE